MLVAPSATSVEFLALYSRKSTLDRARRHAHARVSGPPVLIASYSGVLGGAERVLLDCATRLSRPVTVACPEGPLAAALRAASIEHTPIPARPLKLSAAHVGHVLGLTQDLRRL